MPYLDLVLEVGDNYRNQYQRMVLPHDRLLDKPDELAAMSGPVKEYVMKEGELVEC